MLAAADAVLVASGTAHARGSPLQAPDGRGLQGRADHRDDDAADGNDPLRGLPNILAGEFIVPELLQEERRRSASRPRSNVNIVDSHHRDELEERFTTMHRLLRAGHRRPRGRGHRRTRASLTHRSSSPCPPTSHVTARCRCASILRPRGCAASTRPDEVAGRAGLRGRGDPRSRAADPRAARLEGPCSRRPRASCRSDSRESAVVVRRLGVGRRDRHHQHPAGEPARDASRGRGTRHRSRTRADRRQPVAATDDHVRCHRAGRQQGRGDLGRFDPREDVARCGHARLARRTSAIRLRPARGLRDAATPRIAGVARCLPDPSPDLRTRARGHRGTSGRVVDPACIDGAERDEPVRDHRRKRLGRRVAPLPGPFREAHLVARQPVLQDFATGRSNRVASVAMRASSARRPSSLRRLSGLRHAPEADRRRRRRARASRRRRPDRPGRCRRIFVLDDALFRDAEHRSLTDCRC